MLIQNQHIKGDVSMRKLASHETLSLAKMLEMETQGLAITQTSLIAVSDQQLKASIQSGITAAEARIAGLKQFISENNLANEQQIQQTNEAQGVY
jgi:phosphopantetheine adenylyltransferase